MINAKLIERYERGGEQLAAAVAGLDRKQLTWRPPKGAGVGEWSVQQLVIHLMDSDAIAVERMKRIAAEDEPPLLIGYDETAFNEKLFPDEQLVDYAVKLFDLNRRQFARVLRKLPGEAFKKFGIHNERGRVELGQMLKSYVDHLDHHLKFVDAKRKKLGA